MLLQVLLITILTLVIFIAQQVILKKLSVKDAIKNTCQKIESACLSCKGQFKQIPSKYPKISQKLSAAKTTKTPPKTPQTQHPKTNPQNLIPLKIYTQNSSHLLKHNVNPLKLKHTSKTQPRSSEMNCKRSKRTL
ncbi:Hypothetical_protein [Hexamita inflata]|uniref:Hypothetical_protein n=1 Tax=Hexamita inflata TaxID=28002 RepID=A0AA86UZ54_9EUKA|nr:Hypothetical protein HINF_LOCUS40938 [Hexamita inflata]